MNPYHWDNPPFHWDNPFGSVFYTYGGVQTLTTDGTAAYDPVGESVLIAGGTLTANDTLQVMYNIKLGATITAAARIACFIEDTENAFNAGNQISDLVVNANDGQMVTIIKNVTIDSNTAVTTTASGNTAPTNFASPTTISSNIDFTADMYINWGGFSQAASETMDISNIVVRIFKSDRTYGI